MTTFGHKEKLLLTTEISDNIVNSSSVFDEQTKRAFMDLSKFITNFLRNNSKANSYQLKSLTNELLAYWNENIKPDTERFWTELRKKGVDFERKDPLRFVLDKNKFRSVEHGIDARNYWSELKKFTTIKERFSKTEIEQIDRIIIEDESIRLGILKKCLKKKEIPQTQYLKFGECMGYFANCRLFDNYFKQEDVEELYSIWINFESK